MNDRMLRDFRARLSDDVRMHAYRAATEQVCPEQVVCQIGVGIGSLSLMALQAGARRVYGIESNSEVLDLATRVIARNGFGPDRFVPVHGFSHRVSLPEAAGVVLSDVLDWLRLGVNPKTLLDDARSRLAAPGCTFVPCALESHAALARPEAFRSECEFWDADLFVQHGMDFADVLPRLRSGLRRIRVRGEELTSGWERLGLLDFTADGAADPGPAARLTVRKPGTTTGFCLAYDATLVDGVRVTTRPPVDAEEWEQAFHPFTEPLVCGEGGVVEVVLHTPADGSLHTTVQSRVRRLSVEEARGE